MPKPDLLSMSSNGQPWPQVHPGCGGKTKSDGTSFHFGPLYSSGPTGQAMIGIPKAIKKKKGTP